MTRGILLALLFFTHFTHLSFAQSDVPRSWHLLDYDQDSFYGISLNKAYQFLSTKNKTAQPIIVAVLDSGVDTTHEDLKKILWTNPKEIAGNGIDDDHNGYIDDVHGWNFIGGKDGRNIKKAADERSRIYHRWKELFNAPDFDSTKLSNYEKEAYVSWKKAAEKMNFSQE